MSTYLPVQQDPNTPTIWRFIADPNFSWTDLAEEVIYLDTYVEGVSHTDAATTNTGIPSKWNIVMGDLYNRIGWVKNTLGSAGNRGYLKPVIINATRNLLPADNGLITIETTDVFGSPSTAVALTLPTRAALVTAGASYFERTSVPPYLNNEGQAITPFIINGYQTATGQPLTISVANPTTPSGTPPPGSDFAQAINFGNIGFTTINLYKGEYAEIVPFIVHDSATDYWYLTWQVNVHNTGYQKLILGGTTAGVTVGSAGYPTLNYSAQGNYYQFNIDSNQNLSFLPENQKGGTILYIRAKTSVGGGSWTLKHNASGPPTGLQYTYKPILAPNGTDMAMVDGDIICVIEEATLYRVVSIIGAGANFSDAYSVISGAQTTASNAASAAAAAQTTANTANTNLATEITNRQIAILNLVEGTPGVGVENMTTLTEDLETAQTNITAITANPSSESLAYDNAWTSATPTGQYAKTAIGVVFIKGKIQNTSNANNNTTAFILPSGYRPAQTVTKVCSGYANGATNVLIPVWITVNTDGTVVVNFPNSEWSSLGAQVFLDFSFPIW